MQDASIASFYTASVNKLNAVSMDRVEQSKSRLEVFKASQTDQRTPRKKKLQKQTEAVTSDVTPLITEASAHVQAATTSNDEKLAALNKGIELAFNEMSLHGSESIQLLMQNSTADLEELRDKGVAAQLQLREDHLHKIIRDVKQAEGKMDDELSGLSGIYKDQLITLDTYLDAALKKYQVEAQKILDGLDNRMDKAEQQAGKDYLSGKLQRDKNVYNFEQAKMRLTGTEDCYKLYKQYTNNKTDGTKKTLEQLLSRHGFKGGIAEYAALVKAFEYGFRLTVSATALDMVGIFEKKLNKAQQDYSNLNNVKELFNELSPFRSVTREALKYQDIANELAEKSHRSEPPTPSSPGGRPVILSREEQNRYDNAANKVRAAEVTGRNMLKPLYDRHPIFDDENLNIDYRTPKAKIGSAKTPQELQKLLLDYIAARKADITTAKTHILEDEGKAKVYSMDKVVAATLTNFNITPGSVGDQIIQEAISDEGTKQLVIGIIVAIISIALMIISLGTATPAIVAGASAFLALSIDAYYVVESLDQYERDHSYVGAGLISEDPTMLWVILSVAGAAIDVASLVKALKVVQPFVRSFEATGDVARFEKALLLAERQGQLDTKLGKRILQGAEARTGYNNAAKNFYRITSRRLYTGIDPAAVAEMVKMAYYAIREGVATFDQFVMIVKNTYIERKLMTLSDNFNPEELTAIKKAWQKGAGEVEKGLANFAGADGTGKLSSFVNLEEGAQVESFVEELVVQLSNAKGKWPFDPLKVVQVDGKNIILDGAHRIEAAREVGFLGDIPFEIIPIEESGYTLNQLRGFIR